MRPQVLGQRPLRLRRVVARGEVYLPPKATRLLLQQYRNAPADSTQGLQELSAREREVMALTAEGFSSREIGEKLFISPKTVGRHVENLYRKIGVRSRAAGVAVSCQTS